MRIMRHGCAREDLVGMILHKTWLMKPDSRHREQRVHTLLPFKDVGTLIHDIDYEQAFHVGQH